MILVIAAAFIVGSLSTATFVDAKKETKAAADSFFDIFVERIGSSPAAIDSFFDVFFDVEFATGDPDFDLLFAKGDSTSKIREIEARLGCLEVPSLCPAP